jgi:hypothetical protein
VPELFAHKSIAKRSSGRRPRKRSRIRWLDLEAATARRT